MEPSTRIRAHGAGPLWPVEAFLWLNGQGATPTRVLRPPRSWPPDPSARWADLGESIGPDDLLWIVLHPSSPRFPNITRADSDELSSQLAALLGALGPADRAAIAWLCEGSMPMLSPFPSRRELVTVVQRVWNNEKPVEHWCCVAWYKIICLRQAVVCLAAAAQPLSPWVDNAPLPPVSASAALDPEFLDIREDGVLNDEMNVQALCDGVLMEMNRRSGYEVERLRDWIEEVERDVLGIQSDDPSIDLPKTLMVTANLVSSIARTYRQIAWEFHTTLRFQLPDTYGTATDRAARRAARETYRAITETVTRLQHEIRDVADSARNAIATRQLMAAQAQESAAREQQEISERFQRLAAGFASVVLIPALVATVFAADVPIPHRGTFSALVALVALMAASAAGSWVLVVGRLQPMSTVWKRLLIAAAVVGIVIGVLGLAGVFGGHHTVARPKHARHRTQH